MGSRPIWRAGRRGSEDRAGTNGSRASLQLMLPVHSHNATFWGWVTAICFSEEAMVPRSFVETGHRGLARSHLEKENCSRVTFDEGSWGKGQE